MNEKGLEEDGKKSDEDEIEHTLGPKVYEQLSSPICTPFCMHIMTNKKPILKYIYTPFLQISIMHSILPP